MRIMRALAATVVIVGLSTAARAQTPTITVNWNDTYQTIDGFGVGQEGNGQVGSPPWYLQAWEQDPARIQIMDLAFSQALGIGLTVFRTQIPVSLEASLGVWNYGDPTQVWLMQQAAIRGPVKLFASVWSPPAWMKTNNRTFGGTCSNTGATCSCDCDCKNNCQPSANCSVSNPPLNCACLTDGGGPSYCLSGSVATNHYQDYADYLSHYASQYASSNGVNIYALSMANEPDTHDVGWDTCAWSSDQLANFLNNQLTTTFANNHITTKVIPAEPADWEYAENTTPPWPLPSNGIGPYLSYPEASGSHFDIAAGHTYGGNWSLPFQGALNAGKKVWQTEASLTYSPWDIHGALSWAKELNDSLTLAQVSAWNYFNLALYPDGASLMSLDSDATFSVSKFFWAFGNYSKFIRPGFVRLGTTFSPTILGVFQSAFKNPMTGQLVIVVINQNTSAVTINLTAQGFTLGVGTPYITSSSQNLAPQSPIWLTSPVTIPAQSIVTYVQTPISNFNAWANSPHARALAGDFNGDGYADIALVGGDGWTTVPVAMGHGDGTFTVTNYGLWDFASWANAPGAQVVVGDIDGDGKDDLIATGAQGWYTIPVALSNGNGSFTTKNLANAYIPGWATAQGVKVLVGDVNNDGRDDIILTGGAGWYTIPVGFSHGDGTFDVTNLSVSSYWSNSSSTGWSQDSSAKASITDVDGDGFADIILTSGSTWTTVPVARSLGNGSFSVYNNSEPNISEWSKDSGARLLTGCTRTVARALKHPCDVNADHKGDIILTGGVGGGGWITIPVAMSNGNFTFADYNVLLSEFPIWARDPLVQAVSGDFDGDGRADVALVGGNEYVGSPRWTLPIAYSSGNGSFTVSNFPIQ